MKFEKEKFISLPEAADMLDISPLTLRSWIKKKEEIKKKPIDELTGDEKNFKCPHYWRIGVRFKILREDVEKMIEESMKSS